MMGTAKWPVVVSPVALVVRLALPSTATLLGLANSFDVVHGVPSRSCGRNPISGERQGISRRRPIANDVRACHPRPAPIEKL